MAETTSNRIRVDVGGQIYSLSWSARDLSGELLEVVEDHLEGEPVLAWMRRLSIAFERGFRMTELRAKDILAIVYMARAQVEPDITWRDVARTTYPYTVKLADEEPAGGEPGQPVTQPRNVVIDAPTEQVPAEAQSSVLAALEKAKATKPADEPAPKDEALTSS